MAHLTEPMQGCLEMCDECRRVCLSTMAHCLEKGGAHADADHIRTLLDCAEACQTSASFLARGSELHTEISMISAEACEVCAESCEGFRGDREMAECADVCRRCAETCRQMAGSAA
jgi:hypothetical protein